MARQRDGNRKDELQKQFLELQERMRQIEAELSGHGDNGQPSDEIEDPQEPDLVEAPESVDGGQLSDRRGDGLDTLRATESDDWFGPSDQLPLDGFEVFTGRRHPITTLVPRAAIQRRGNLSLNRASFKALGQPDAVIFGYNPASREIALRGAAKSVAFATPVRKQQAAESYLVAAGSFVATIGLDVEGSILVFDSIEVRGDTLILALDRARKVPSRSRGRYKKGEPEPDS